MFACKSKLGHLLHVMHTGDKQTASIAKATTIRFIVSPFIRKSGGCGREMGNN